MDTSRHSEKNEGKTASQRPVDISDWDKDHVRQWMLEIQMDERYADILYNQGMNGAGLLHLKEAYRLMRNLPLNALELIFQNIDLLKEKTQKSCSLKPYPFNRYDATYRYTENSILDVTETGPTDLIQPCHEFKAFTNAQEEKYVMEKYTYEVIRFAAACMNSRTNGTIHFGVADKPHGQILGVSVLKTMKKDDFDVQQKHAIERHFKEKKVQKEKREKNVQIAKKREKVQIAEREKDVYIAESEQNVQIAEREKNVQKEREKNVQTAEREKNVQTAEREKNVQTAEREKNVQTAEREKNVQTAEREKNVQTAEREKNVQTAEREKNVQTAEREKNVQTAEREKNVQTAEREKNVQTAEREKNVQTAEREKNVQTAEREKNVQTAEREKNVQTAEREKNVQTAEREKNVQTAEREKNVQTAEREKNVQTAEREKNVQTAEREKNVQTAEREKNVQTAEREKNVQTAEREKNVQTAEREKNVQTAEREKNVQTAEREKNVQTAEREKNVQTAEREKNVQTAEREKNVQTAEREKNVQIAEREKNVQIAEREKDVHIAESEQNVQVAKRCIKPPRFVEVLKADMTSSGKYVIEVDIEPSSIVCQDFYFKTFDVVINEHAKKKKGGESFFIRDGSSSSNLVEYKKYIENNPQLSKERKDAEEKHLSVVKIHAHGSALSEMITGGTHSMDGSRFMSYIVVANKSHPVQLKNLDFLHCMNLMAVLDFDPQSAENGLKTLLDKKRFNDHLPAQYKDTGAVEDIASSLDLTKKTSWVFCNGGINGETPSDAEKWRNEKGASVRDVVSFLCRKVLPRKKLLVIFLLLSQVSEASDPLFQTFSMFQQELKGQNQLLCISDNETSYTYWNDLIKQQHKCDISKCIYELSFAEINGTILSLWSEKRKFIRFLPSCGGSKVALFKNTEESLHMLSILCVYQCDGGHQDRQLHEENFHKGGKVSWWNFYYSEQPGSASVIKRDKLDYIVNTIIPNMLNQKRACVFFNIFHAQGCGGTTLAMHVLWTLKEDFRCAVLKDTTDDYTTAAKQVVQLLTYKAKEQPTRLPVLLMTDHFQDIRNVLTLQHRIEEECLDQHIFSKSPQVIIVNCMRVDSCEPTEGTGDAVFIPNYLSENELKLFEEKMEEFKKTNKNTETFYLSMIVDNFSSGYIQYVVKNILKDFDFQHKHAQLFAILVLLHVYSKNALLSVSTCEEFLGLQTEAESRKVEDAFEKFSSLLKRSTVFSKVTFEGMMVKHSRIAQLCLEELSASRVVTKAQIANLLLTTDLFYERTPEKQKFMQDVQDMLMKSQYSAKHEYFFFSRLIQDIMKETPGMEETVLLNAAECLREKEVIFQLLARYYCIKQQEKDNNDPIKPDSLNKFLTLAGHLGEHQTAAKVIEILLKIPFKARFTYNNWLTQVLWGQITIKDLSRENPELEQYCDVLQIHERILLQLKDKMKQ